MCCLHMHQQAGWHILDQLAYFYSGQVVSQYYVYFIYLSTGNNYNLISWFLEYVKL